MADLAGSSWQFDDVAGDPVGDVPERSRPALTFEADGQVYGTGGVNRIRGTYSLVGDTLELGPLATTLMAGTPAHMARESAVLALLSGPLTLTVDGDALELVDPQGRRTHLSRTSPTSRLV